MIDFNQIDASFDTTLRPYQIENKQKIYNFWETGRTVMLQMPTGTGKTRVFVSIAKDIERWNRQNNQSAKILFIAHRIELVNQISDTLFDKYQLNHGLIISKNRERKDQLIQVCSLLTFKNRLNDWSDNNFDVIIVDEAHHVPADSYRKILSEYPNAKVLGVTATPYRLNGEGFLEDFETLITSNSVSQFIKQKYLCDYEYYSIKPSSKVQELIDKLQLGFDGDYLESAMSATIDTDAIRSRIVQSYKNYADGKKGIVYTINRAHNINVCNQFNSNGIPAMYIDSMTPPDERAKIVKQFKDGEFKILCNVNIFSEGFDCPDLEFVQLARPTISLSLFLQQVGRGLRPHKTKDKAIFLDNVGLYNRFGLPSSNRKWQYHFEGKPEFDEIDTMRGTASTDVIFMDEIEEGDESIELIHESQSEIAEAEQGCDNSVNPNIINFTTYLSNSGYNESRINAFISAIRDVLNPYLRAEGYLFADVFNILDTSKLLEIKTIITQDINSNIYKVCMYPLNKYIGYINYIEGVDILGESPLNQKLVNDEKMESYESQYKSYLIYQSVEDHLVYYYVLYIRLYADIIIRDDMDSSHKSIFNIDDVELLEYISQELPKSNRFIRLAKQKRTYISASMSKYIEFIKSLTEPHTTPEEPKTQIVEQEMEIIQENIPVINSIEDETPTASTRTLEEVDKEIEILKRYKATIPEALSRERAYLERENHIREKLPKLIKSQLQSIFEDVEADVEIQLTYTKSGGLIVKHIGSDQSVPVAPEKRTRKRGKLKVTFTDGITMQYPTDRTTLIEVIKRIGIERVEQLNIRCAGTNLIERNISDKPFVAKQQIEIGEGVWLNNLSNSATKQRQLEKISNALGLKLKIEM